MKTKNKIDNGLIKPFEDGFLLSSLINFKPLIEHIVKVLNLRSISEVGIDRGLFSAWLIELTKKENITYKAIDPVVPDSIKNLLNENEYIEKKSIPFLKNVKKLDDLYFIDGDHNYYTVSNELRLIKEKSMNSKLPVFIFHDINWPWGRRDFYYNINDIPPEHRNDSTNKKSISIDNSETSNFGFRAGKGELLAKKEGGEKNGVLTAVEDFMSEYKKESGRSLALIKIPVFFGLGILYDSKLFSKSQNKELDNIANTHENISLILNQMEHNRVSLILELLKLRNEVRELKGKKEKGDK